MRLREELILTSILFEGKRFFVARRGECYINKIMMFKDFYYRLVTSSVLASSLWWYEAGESKRGSLRVLVKNGFVVT